MTAREQRLPSESGERFLGENDYRETIDRLEALLREMRAEKDGLYQAAKELSGAFFRLDKYHAWSGDDQQDAEFDHWMRIARSASEHIRSYAALAEPAQPAQITASSGAELVNSQRPTAFTAPSSSLRDAAKRVVETQRNDTRTLDEKLRDGVRFVIGPGND